MKNRLLLFLAFTLFVRISAFAQVAPQAPDPEKFTEAELKKIAKAHDYFDKNKFEKAILLIEPIQQTHLQNEELWNLRVQCEYYIYLKQADHYSGKHPNYNLPPGAEAKEHFKDACQKATLYCKKQELASVFLRVFWVDESVDKHVRDNARDAYDEGEEAFENGDYVTAEKQFKKAYEKDTTYYKAALYLGDSYYNDKEYEKAIPWLKKSVRMHPELLQGHKFLTDAYMKLHLWKEAYDACINGILCYPDVSMFTKMEDICDGLDKKFDRKWMPRFYMPNMVGEVQEPIAETPWSYYRHAKNDGESSFNRFGIQYGKDSVVTCFETYSWNQMLEKDKANTAELETAREMKEAGFLDCYVMVSLFHHSIYKQYTEFARTNADHIRMYFDKYLTKPL